MPTGHVYNIRAPDGTSIYIGSTTKTEATRWRCWKTAANVDYLSCPLLLHLKAFDDKDLGQTHGRGEAR